MFKWRFALLYAAVVVACISFDVYAYTSPAKPKTVTIKPCAGIHGVERCVRSQLAAQGATDMELTCAQTKLANVTSYLCDAQFGLGGGCADVIATRDKNGYPIIEAGAQKACG